MNAENENDRDDPGEPFPEERREPIPRILYSFYEERPFRTCTRCGESLA